MKKKQVLIDTFETELSNNIKRNSYRKELSSEEILDLLTSYGEVEEINEEEANEYYSIMDKAKKARLELHQKVNNIEKFSTFGDLLLSFSEYHNLSINKLSALLGISKNEFNSYANNRVSLENFGVERFFTILLIFNLSFKNLINILDKTVRFQRISKNTNVSAGNARSDKNLDQGAQNNVVMDAMTELLLAVEPEGKNEHERDYWAKFKEGLDEYINIEQKSDYLTSCMVYNKNNHVYYKQIAFESI